MVFTFATPLGRYALRKIEGKFPMFFVWFLRLTTPLMREAQFTPPKTTSCLKNTTLMQTFARASFCNCVPTKINIKNLPGISVSKLHRKLEGKFQCVFNRFLGFVIRPLREAKFTPLIFKIFCKSTTLMQTFACPDR